jgi:uncharacterized protein (TIGR02265 family)
VAEELLIFGHVIEGLSRAIASRMTPRLEARLREAGLDVKAKFASSYKFAVWCHILQICREEVYGALTPGEGFQKLGEGFATAYFQTTFGSAVMSVTKLLGPVRTLKRATQNFRSANNFTDTRVQEFGHNDWELRMNRVDDRDFTAGIIKMLMQVAGAKNVAVAHTAGQGHEAVFRISWT